MMIGADSQALVAWMFGLEEGERERSAIASFTWALSGILRFESDFKSVKVF